MTRILRHFLSFVGEDVVDDGWWGESTVGIRKG